MDSLGIVSYNQLIHTNSLSYNQLSHMQSLGIIIFICIKRIDCSNCSKPQASDALLFTLCFNGYEELTDKCWVRTPSNVFFFILKHLTVTVSCFGPLFMALKIYYILCEDKNGFLVPYFFKFFIIWIFLLKERRFHFAMDITYYI